MPYKHIAAHLKKTELACRLHYHQLSHGSNRRKRTTSMSSSGSSNGHSPIMHATIPSPIHEHTPSRSVSPPGSLLGYGNHPSSPAGSVQLPSIMNAAGGNNNNSPRLPAILPKPANMNMTSRYSPLHEHSTMATTTTAAAAPLLPAATFSNNNTANGPHGVTTMAPLRLDCSSPVSSISSSSSSSSSSVDMGRLNAAYNSHRMNFWNTVAAEYGHGIHPTVLEQAWRSGSPSTGVVSTAATAAPIAMPMHTMSHHHHHHPHHHNSSMYSTVTPITPVGSPDERDIYGKADKTRISAILGIDANPRSPKERELVRRMEEERVMVGVGA